MIVLDTHVWVWWIDGQPPLSAIAERVKVRYEQTHNPELKPWHFELAG